MGEQLLRRHLIPCSYLWFTAISLDSGVLQFLLSALALLVGGQEGHPACKKISHQLSPKVPLWKTYGETRPNLE